MCLCVGVREHDNFDSMLCNYYSYLLITFDSLFLYICNIGYIPFAQYRNIIRKQNKIILKTISQYCNNPYTIHKLESFWFINIWHFYLVLFTYLQHKCISQTVFVPVDLKSRETVQTLLTFILIPLYNFIQRLINYSHTYIICKKFSK